MEVAGADLEGQDLAGGALEGDGLAVEDHGLDALAHHAGYDGRYVWVLARVVLAVPAAATHEHVTHLLGFMHCSFTASPIQLIKV